MTNYCDDDEDYVDDDDYAVMTNIMRLGTSYS